MVIKFNMYTVPLCCVCGFKMLPIFSCSAPVVCGSALSDLSKSSLLHILHPVPPLEPKRWGRVETHILKINIHIMSVFITVSL